MDEITILIVLLIGAVVIFFNLPSKAAPAAPEPKASKPKPKPKVVKKRRQVNRGSPTNEAEAAEAAAAKAKAEAEAEARAEAIAAKKKARKQRQKAAKRAAKEQEEAEARAAAKAAKAASKKAKRKGKKAAAAATETSLPVVDNTADSLASWVDDDDEAGEWVEKPKKAKKAAKGSRSGSASPSRANRVTRTIQVENIPALIGRGGANVRHIREETGVIIKVPGRDETGKTVTVIGDAESVAQALTMIQEGVGDGSPRVDDRDSETMVIQPNEVGFIIGQRGSTIKEIEAVSGASVKVPKDKEAGTVTIRGDLDQIDTAKHLISKAIAGRGLLNGITETLPLGEGQAGAIIGPKGVTINSIRDKTNAQLNVGDSSVEIFGTPESVKAAAAEIATILANYTTIAMHVDDRQRGTVIGSKGATVNALQKSTGASIRVDAASSMVTISGSKAAVARAQAKITELLEAPRTFSELPEGVHSVEMELGAASGRVIGRQGAKVKEIKKESGAELDFIDQTCRISGTEEQVAAAQALVQAVVDAEAKRQERAAAAAAARAEAAAKAAEAGEGKEGEGGDPEVTAEDQLGGDDLMVAAGW